MLNKNIVIQLRVLFWVTIANFIAQIPYFFHLYYQRVSDLKRLIGLNALPMYAVLALFLFGYILLVKRRPMGYWLLVLFLCLEFLFYLWNTIGEVIHRYGLFFHIHNTNLLLRTVFEIGYLNLFASGYFLMFLIYKRKSFLRI